MNVCYRSGIYLPDLDLRLDPTVRCARAIVTHAHSDHVRRHARSIVTPATARLISHRYRWGGFQEAPFGASLTVDGAEVTLLPAGHVLGSAQVLVEHGGRRLLYSGDLRLAPARTAEPAEIPHADTLVVEATFGRPRYRFPPPDEVVPRIVAFCRATLAAGSTPALLAYSLGKAQEVLAHLSDAGFRVALHPDCHDMARVYEDLGVSFASYERLNGAPPPDAVVLAPPGARRSLVAQLGDTVRTAFISGWAVEPGARYRLGVDAAFPLSDHADYDELLAYVERVAPERVFTVYGSAAEFAADLAARGYDARPLRGPMQYQLM